MRKILYSICMMVMLFTLSCEDKLPEASWSLNEITNLSATPMDEAVTLNWEASSDAINDGYYVSWTPSTTSAESGNITTDKNSITIDNLVNKISYTFSVQAIYGDKRSGKVSIKATPVTSRKEPLNYQAIAGDGKVKLLWEKPAQDVIGYKITVQPDNKTIEIDDSNIESYIVSELNNGTEYTISLQAVYDKGDSEPVSAEVTPGDIEPITGFKTYVLANETMTLSYNDMYFMGEVKSVNWTFGDETSEKGNSVEKSFTSGGEYKIKIEVTYSDDQVDETEKTVYVIAKKWTMDKTNYIKTSNPVFSMDGKTFYLPTADKGSFGINAYSINDNGLTHNLYSVLGSAKTYGGGCAVDKDDVIYQGARDGKLYAISKGGTQKWTYETGATNKNLDCFPAVKSDGSIVYILDGDNVLHAIKTDDGSKVWTANLDGTANKAGAVAIDKDGRIYAGTRSYIYAFNQEGEQLWRASATVTEIGSFAIDGSTLYAAQISGAGLVAINTADGSIKWTVPASGDAYAPVVGKNGNVYFVDKGGKSLYAVNSQGVLEWKFNAGAALTYCFPALDEKGIIYFGAADGVIHAVDTSTGEEVWNMTTDASGDNKKIMAGMTVGPDKNLYVGYIGGNVVAIPVFAGPETSTWSCRGGNIHGTNQY